MATIEQLLFSHKKFMFRGKKYKFYSYIPIPSITIIAEDGSLFSFGEYAPIRKKFILIHSQQILDRNIILRYNNSVYYIMAYFELTC